MDLFNLKISQAILINKIINVGILEVASSSTMSLKGPNFDILLTTPKIGVYESGGTQYHSIFFTLNTIKSTISNSFRTVVEKRANLGRSLIENFSFDILDSSNGGTTTTKFNSKRVSSGVYKIISTFVISKEVLISKFFDETISEIKSSVSYTAPVSRSTFSSEPILFYNSDLDDLALMVAQNSMAINELDERLTDVEDVFQANLNNPIFGILLFFNDLIPYDAFYNAIFKQTTKLTRFVQNKFRTVFKDKSVGDHLLGILQKTSSKNKRQNNNIVQTFNSETILSGLIKKPKDVPSKYKVTYNDFLDKIPYIDKNGKCLTDLIALLLSDNVLLHIIKSNITSSIDAIKDFPFGKVETFSSPIEELGSIGKIAHDKFKNEVFSSSSSTKYPFHTSQKTSSLDLNDEGEWVFVERFSGIGEPSINGPTNFKNPKVKIGYIKIESIVKTDTSGNKYLELKNWKDTNKTPGEKYTKEDIDLIFDAFSSKHEDIILTTDEKWNYIRKRVDVKYGARSIEETIPINNPAFLAFCDNLFDINTKSGQLKTFKSNLLNQNCQTFVKTQASLFTSALDKLPYKITDAAYAEFLENFKSNANVWSDNVLIVFSRVAKMFDLSNFVANISKMIIT